MTNILVLAANADLTRQIQAIPGHTVVLVGREQVDHITRLDGAESVLGLDPENMPAIVILGDEIPVGEALSIAQNLDTDFPAVELMLIAKADTELALRAMRVGVREIAEPTIAGDELKVLLHRASGNVSNRLKSHLGGGDGPDLVRDSRVIVIASPKGGVGKSTIAANLAIALAATAPMETVLVDLDVQFGDAASLLNLQPTHSIADAFGTTAALDTLILKTFLTVHPAGFYVLCGSESPTFSDKVSGAHIKRLLHQLSAQFRNVIVDTSAGLNEHTLAALEAASEVILVSSMDVSSIRSVRKAVEVLSELNLLPMSRHVVLNFADRRSGLSVRDVEAVIGMPVDVAFPRSADVPVCGNRGEPFMLKKRGGPIAKSMNVLVGRLNGDLGKQSGKRSKRAGEAA
jgi:pilus assembly protein CpaE